MGKTISLARFQCHLRKQLSKRDRTCIVLRKFSRCLDMLPSPLSAAVAIFASRSCHSLCSLLTPSRRFLSTSSNVGLTFVVYELM